MKLSLVVPCYNEEANVKRFFNEVNNAFLCNVDDYEFVFVNDGSEDKTFDNLKELYEENSAYNIQVLSFSRNFGKESAMYAGLKASRGDYVCIIDADLQQSPEVVLKMLEEIEKDENIDCVAAYQEERNEGALLSNFKSAFYTIINKLAEVDFVNGASDFRLLNRKMVDAVLSMSEYHRFSKGIFSWVGFNTKYIAYEAEEREYGESKWSFLKLFKYAIDGIVAFSTLPLRLSIATGFITAIASIIYLIVVVFQKLIQGIDVPGYASIIVLILFLGGMQLFCLGILGEYLAKVYVQTKNRPLYILKEHLGKENKNENDYYDF
ncbi:MAG: glycosyltransferase family 2 protein [Ruminococcaceae bacterium]|nr:glycosyltransferase family 2 protein [Oscillospiraceae bacterium]